MTLIAEQWTNLSQKATEKSLKLKEANKQRTFNAAVKDINFWLGKVESLLKSEGSGKDLVSVQNLINKHQLADTNIQAHQDRIKDVNGLADCLIESALENWKDLKRQARRRYNKLEKSLNDL